MYEESSSPVIQETLQFPIQKVSCGIGGIGIGHTVKNEFCSSCSYNDLPRVLTYGGHQRFQVELRPREMTIVSWKKLVKDANRAVEKDKSTAKELPIFEKPVVKAPVDSVCDSRNCFLNGRVDTDFLKWRWQPDTCQISRFNLKLFLKIVRGKSMAFRGNSVARNHMESLLCLF
ncbi:hypothetical protein AgCh_028279 [Apium graveolens]